MIRKLQSYMSLLLALCLLFGLCANSFCVLAEGIQTNDNDVIRYASLGASNTNGYGVRGYLPIEVTMDPLVADKSTLNVYGYDRAPATAYPAQVAVMLGASSGKEVQISQLAISSMRVEEVRVLLDDSYYGDAYTAWRFYNEKGEGWFAQAESKGANSGTEALANLRAAYREALGNADVITVDLGMNNFGVYTFNNIKSVLGNGTFWKAPDFSLLMSEENLDTYIELKRMILGSIASGDVVDAETRKRLDMACDVLCYALIGFCYNFDIVIEKIYDMNPDAQIVVVGVQNLLHGIQAGTGLGTLPLDKAYGLTIDLANYYTKSVSPHAYKYAHVIVGEGGHVHTFLDEILEWNGDPTTLTDNMKDCFDMYDDNLYVRSIIEYVLVAPALGIQMPASLQSMIASGNISLDKLDLSDLELLAYIGRAAQKLATFRLGQNLAENEKPIYQAYVNTLNTVYDIVATIVQEAAKIDTLDFGAGGFDGFGGKSDQLMGYIFGEVIKGAQTSFLGTLQDPNFKYHFDMDKTLLQDPGIALVAMLAVRFDLGNSFYAHPSDKGHDELTDAIIQALKDGPSDTACLHHYTLAEDSYYLALGDAKVVGTAADSLAQRLNAAAEGMVGYANMTVADQTASQLLVALPEYTQQIQQADLISLAFSPNSVNQFLAEQLQAVMSNKEHLKVDWSAVLGEEYGPRVKQKLEEIMSEIVNASGTEMIMGLNVGKILGVALESYAYGYIQHLIGYYRVCAAIHAINPKVQILTIGAYNPMDGVILNVKGTEVDLGRYVGYLVQLTNLVYLGAATITETCTYVQIPDAKTAVPAGIYEVGPFIMELLLKGAGKYDMSAESYAHVEEQLWNALDVFVKNEEPEPEQPEVTLGDVDGNGTVNFSDAMLTLQYYTQEIGADKLDVSAADMDGNGTVDFGDSLLILKVYTQEK